MREPWQQFQADFGIYLRDPSRNELPADIPPRRSKVYEDLLFNNLQGFINNCFPVCKRIMNGVEWCELARAFFRDWRCHSPRFNDIPKEFLDFLISDQAPALPYPWFTQLAHYEWVELAVDTFDESGVNSKAHQNGVITNPSLHNLVYDWPVHQISPDYLPEEPKQTCLVVYRNAQDKVEFTEVNPATSALIHIFSTQTLSAEAGLKQLAEQMQAPFTEAFKRFGLEMIQQLQNQGIFLDKTSEY